MTTTPYLPTPLPHYFGRTNATHLADLFAPTATVRDEGKIHHGRAEIAQWLESVETRYHPRYRVIGADNTGQAITVTFEVSGTFPGSPATLRQNFVLANDLNQSIETL
jgi:hypothetical protein